MLVWPSLLLFAVVGSSSATSLWFGWLWSGLGNHLLDGLLNFFLFAVVGSSSATSLWFELGS